MAQLMMSWIPGTPIAVRDLPEGYTVSRYRGAQDKAAWCECCKNGLIADTAGDSAFDSRILADPHIRPEEDVFFLDHNGAHIATVTAFYKEEVQLGDMHMVGIRTDYRGKGLAKYLTQLTLTHLSGIKGLKAIHLTTDEWRTPAIRSYISGGFHPVEYDTGMEERWLSVMRALSVPRLTMVREDNTFYKVLHV